MNDEHEFNIRQIQRALRILHKNGDDIPIIYEDGIFGEETKRAVIAFQAQKSLDPTGTVDYGTWVLLMEKANEYIEKAAEPFPIFPYVNDEKSGVLPDEEGKTVWFLQAMLIAIGEKYSGVEEVMLNGKTDFATQNALNYIHSKNRSQNAEGKLSKESWNSVARLFNSL